MKKKITLLFVFCFSLANLHLMAQNNNHKDQLLRHVVLFKFKDTASAAGIQQVEDAFRALPKKISLIKNFEWGINNSPENLNNGFTHCFFVSFKSEADRDAYIPNPDHQAFVAVLKPYLDKVLVIDYWTKK